MLMFCCCYASVFPLFGTVDLSVLMDDEDEEEGNIFSIMLSPNIYLLLYCVNILLFVQLDNQCALQIL